MRITSSWLGRRRRLAVGLVSCSATTTALTADHPQSRRGGATGANTLCRKLNTAAVSRPMPQPTTNSRHELSIRTLISPSSADAILIGSHQPERARLGRGLGAVAGAQQRHDAGHVGLDRGGREAEL